MRKHDPDNEISPGIIKADIVTAEQSISYFKEHKIKDIKNIAAYHLQQAIEKLIKIQIYDASVKLENSKLFTHNIEGSQDQVLSISSRFSPPSPRWKKTPPDLSKQCLCL